MVTNCFDSESLYTCQSKEETKRSSIDQTVNAFFSPVLLLQESPTKAQTSDKEYYSFDSSDVDSDHYEEAKDKEDSLLEIKDSGLFKCEDKVFMNFVNGFRLNSKIKFVSHSNCFPLSYSKEFQTLLQNFEFYRDKFPIVSMKSKRGSLSILLETTKPNILSAFKQKGSKESGFALPGTNPSLFPLL